MLGIILQATEAINKVQISAVEKAAAKHLSFFDLFLKGGYILIPLVMLSVIAVYLIISKTIEIFKLASINDDVLQKFNNSLETSDFKAFEASLKGKPDSYSQIFATALEHSNRPVKDIEGVIETAANIEVSRMNKNLGYLSLIAGVAPMLGFIGTITGVIKIFYNISITDNISIGIISGGLYEKMISSGTGLFVGVVAFTGYHLLSSKIDNFVQIVEADAFRFINLLHKKNKWNTYDCA